MLVGNPYEVEFVTIASIVEKLRAKAQKTPPGTWVEGYFFDDTKVKDERQLTVQDLDQVSKDQPVVVQHRGGHTVLLQQQGLRRWRASPRTRPIPRAELSTATRTAISTAASPTAHASVFDGVGKRPAFTAKQTMQRDRDGLAYISKQFVRYGLTSVHHEAAICAPCSRCARAASCCTG